MKSVLLMTVCMFVYVCINLGNASINSQASMMETYKRALDSGANAAIKHISYSNQESMDILASGFGEGYQDKHNIYVDKNEALKWFYQVFYRNLGIENNIQVQERLKRYIPMKALILYDRISIADVNDNWIVDKKMIIEHEGVEYLFTLSNQVMNISTGEWMDASNIGLLPEERKELVVKFIKYEIEDFLNRRENMESNLYYTIDFGLNDYDPKVNSINGVNFISLTEGMPIPSLNIFEPDQKLYAFSMGGSEITRKQ